MIKEDKLDIIFRKQKELQINLGVFKKMKNASMKQQFINQMILSIHEETVEIMKETAYKNPNYVPFGWKKGQEFNLENYKKEIADLLHFIINLCLVVNMTSEELFKLYLNKNRENHERKRNNY